MRTFVSFGMRQRRWSGSILHMRTTRTISKYVATEITLYTILGLVLSSSVLLTSNVVRRLGGMLIGGLTGSELVAVVSSLALIVGSYSAPMAFLLGSGMTIRRLAADSELLALRSCGLGDRVILKPTLMVGVLISLITGYLTIDVENRARRELRTTFEDVVTRTNSIRAGEFRGFNDLVVFVRGKDNDGGLTGIMISDRTEPERPVLIFAETGRLVVDHAQASLKIHLGAGDIHVEPDPGSLEYKRIAFDSLTYPIELETLLGPGKMLPTAKEMSVTELRAVLTRIAGGDLRSLAMYPVEYEIELHRRFALPFAPILFAFVAVSLGAGRRGGRAWGGLLSAALALAYYLVLIVGESLSREQGYPASITMWLPNASLSLLVVATYSRRGHRG